MNCNDDNNCTEDICNGTGCIHLHKNCDDDNACTAEYCDALSGTCQYTELICDDQKNCTDDICNGTGCIHLPKDCDDNNTCTEEYCNSLSGICEYTQVKCDDQDKCTEDHCDAILGCWFTKITNCTTTTTGGGNNNGTEPAPRENPVGSLAGFWNLFKVLEGLMGEKAEDVSISVVSSVGVFSVLGIIILCVLSIFLLLRAHPPKADGKYVAL
jgi:hypothetical protein